MGCQREDLIDCLQMRMRIMMTQDELAARLSVSKKTVSNWERRQREGKLLPALVGIVLQAVEKEADNG